LFGETQNTFLRNGTDTMDQMQTGKDLMDFNKKAFNNYFAILGIFQDQAEKILIAMVDQFPAFSEEAKKNMDYWTNANKQVLDNYKTIADKSFQKVEECFVSSKKE